VVDAFRPWFADLPTVVLSRVVGSQRGTLGLLWPEIAHGATTEPHGDPESGRWRLFEAVASFIRSIVDDRPLLLVVDDLQWAEPSTRLLLVHLTRAAVPAFGLLATVRPAVKGADPVSVLGDLGTDRHLDVVALGGLAPADVTELVGIHAGAEPPVEFAAERCRQTDGNPFFIGSLLAHLEEVAHVRDGSGTWLTSAELTATGVPSGVRAIVSSRLAVLDNAARRALDVAAVCGLGFHEPVVTAVLGGSVDDSVAALDEAIAAGLVREERAGQYIFAHALVRHSVLDDLSQTRLARLHARVGEELGRHDPTRLGEIAEHVAAGLADADAVVRTSLAAGDDAMRRTAFDEAAAHLRRALEAAEGLPADPNLRYRLLTSLGRALSAPWQTRTPTFTGWRQRGSRRGSLMRS
jgi:predicted ATPase